MFRERRKSHPLVNAYRHAAFVRYAANGTEFETALNQFTGGYVLGLLEYITVQDGTGYFYIQKADGAVVSAIQFLEDSNHIWIQTISTRHWCHGAGVDSIFQRKGYATALRWALMRHTVSQGKVLISSGHTPDGAAHLRAVSAQLHRHIPALKILYGVFSEDIDGHRPYSVSSRGGDCILEFY